MLELAHKSMKEIFAILVVLGAFYIGYSKYADIITPIQELPATIDQELSPVEELEFSDKTAEE